MWEWLQANLYTLIVGAILLAVVALAIRSMIREKKQGKSSCCGDCSRCGGCHGSAK